MSTTALCSRCKEPAKVHMADTPRCEPCFKLYLQRTFKTTVGRLNAGGRRTIAVALSGGESSAAAALLLRDYHNSLIPNPKVPPAHIILVHIISSTNDGDQNIPTSIQEIHNAIPNSQLCIRYLDSNIQSTLSRVRDPTDRANLTTHYIRLTISTAAISNNIDTVILGTSVSRAASDILLSVVCARGTQVVHDANAEMIMNGIRFIRPLNGIPVRLLVRYSRMVLTHTQFIQPDFNNINGARTSLQSIVKSFVSEVSGDNPSSVHNIVKVSERLKRDDDQVATCSLCGYVISNTENMQHQKNVKCKDDGDTFNDVKIDGPSNRKPVTEGCDDCGCDNNVNKELIKKLCRACVGCVDRANPSITTSTNSGDNEDGNENDNPILRLMSRESMRKEIEQFLI